MRRELSGSDPALKMSEHYIIGSPHNLCFFVTTSSSFLYGLEKRIPSRFSHFHLIFLHFQKLKIIWTLGKNFDFLDIPSRNFTIIDIENYQRKHKRLPKDVKFNDDQETRS